MLSTAKYGVVFTSLFLLLTVAACGNDGTTQVPSAATTPNVSIEILDGIHPEAREIRIETIPQNNCGGTAEVENQVEKSRSIVRTIEAGEGVEVNANGQIGFAGTDVELGATVATHFGYSYGTVEDISRSITVKAKPGTRMEHYVSLQEIWEVGTAEIVVNEQEITVPFSFRSDFAIELLDSNEIDCELEPSATSPIVELTDTPTATSVPPTLTPTLPSGQAFDVFDDFFGSLGDNWGDIEGDISPKVLDGALHLDYAVSGGYGGGGIHINNNDVPLKLVATELVVNDARAKSYTYIQVSLGIIDGKPWYANFGIMDTGELFYAAAPAGEAPQGVEKTWSSKGLGYGNVLVVEWTGEEVFFYANSQLLHKVQAKDGGGWVIFGVGAEDNGNSINQFNWAGWSYRR